VRCALALIVGRLVYADSPLVTTGTTNGGISKMVIGLLYNRDGCPVGVEGFRGNTGGRHNG